MSTHALVGVMHGDRFKAIYVHSDGYPSYVGKVLLENYNSAKANELVSMGDCSMLGKEIGVKINFNDHMQYDNENVALQCRFYNRDRDESTSYTSYLSLVEAKLDGYDHIYVMRDGEWYYGIDNTVLLSDMFDKNKEIA